jgi:hypothetical protein
MEGNVGHGSRYLHVVKLRWCPIVLGHLMVLLGTRMEHVYPWINTKNSPMDLRGRMFICCWCLAIIMAWVWLLMEGVC